MGSTGFRNVVVQLVSFALLAMGMVQSSGAALIGTQQLIASDAQQSRVGRIEAMLAQEDVAQELVRLGVAPEDVMARVANLSDNELMTLEGRLDQHVAGGDALALIGAVFLVLLILELVGVTDVFKAI